LGEDAHHPLPAASSIRVEIDVAPVRIERRALARGLEPEDRPSVEARVALDVLAPPAAADGAQRQLRGVALPAREPKLDRTVVEPLPGLKRIEAAVGRLPDDDDPGQGSGGDRVRHVAAGERTPVADYAGPLDEEGVTAAVTRGPVDLRVPGRIDSECGSSS